MQISPFGKIAWLISPVVATALGLSACDEDLTGLNDERATEPFSFAADGSSVSGLRVEAINGTITITGVTGSDSAFVAGEKEVHSNTVEDAEARLDDIDVTVEVADGELAITTVQPEDFDPEGRDYIVNYEVTIPNDWRVVVAQGNGLVTVASIDNDVSVDQGNGDIDLDDVVGDAIVELGNGEIVGTVLLPMNGTIEWIVGNGTIDLRIPTTTSAEFSAAVGNGSINLVNLQLQGRLATSTTLTGILGSGEGKLDLSIGNGILTVTGF